MQVVGDSCGEPNEAFSVDLGAPSGAAIGTAGTGTIQNDDDAVPPAVAVVAPNGGEVGHRRCVATLQWTRDRQRGRDRGRHPAVARRWRDVSRSVGERRGEYRLVRLDGHGPSSPTATAFIKVVAHDAGCNTGFDISDAAFHIAEPVTSVEESGPVTSFALGQVHPNPTPGAAEVDFQLPREAPVRLSVIDVRGREVAPLVNRTMTAGRYRATWNGMTSNGPAAQGRVLRALRIRWQAIHAASRPRPVNAGRH